MGFSILQTSITTRKKAPSHIQFTIAEEELQMYKREASSRWIVSISMSISLKYKSHVNQVLPTIHTYTHTHIYIFYHSNNIGKILDKIVDSSISLTAFVTNIAKI